jgi:hypothetical protein
MEIGDKVKVKGTSLEGEIVSIDNRYDLAYARQSKTTYYKIKFPDGREMEYLRNELRKLE